ncbi:DUF4288 domain-containing protein [Pseudolysobacter antarcticus]|uniref:DUF4288 domain-containing protein n=1 Tax=Pseudolysobacter antarcticus TaxID=2511995 RepID=A0A411HKP5_9GAMM|nr:DUF4288 domain-containing protein [Pseudolysobacter antarcticus]QBB71073.1 DUF4288 domain-containing protein [Pseudolysobacter antarcticus]
MKEWYSVKGLFRWYFKSNGKTDRIEERVLLFKASDFDDALNLAEREATKYCALDRKANFSIEPVGWWHAYWIGDEPASGAEVFSRGCETNLEAQAFVRRYYPKSHHGSANKPKRSVS